MEEKYVPMLIFCIIKVGGVCALNTAADSQSQKKEFFRNLRKCLHFLRSYLL